MDVPSYGSAEDNAFLFLIFFDLIKDRMVEQLMPLNPCLFSIGEHAPDQLHQLIGDLDAGRRHSMLKLETHLEELILAELVLKWEGEVDHPVEGHT